MDTEKRCHPHWLWLDITSGKLHQLVADGTLIKTTAADLGPTETAYLPLDPIREQPIDPIPKNPDQGIQLRRVMNLPPLPEEEGDHLLFVFVGGRHQLQVTPDQPVYKHQLETQPPAR